MLMLPIKRKWFDMIVSGEKKEEYREITPYWNTRILKCGYAGIKFVVRIKNGYQKEAPYADLLVKKTVGFGRPEWGAPADRKVHILQIIDILEVKEK